MVGVLLDEAVSCGDGGEVYVAGELQSRYDNDHPALVLWHLSNEYSGACHCDLCAAAFREWLRDRLRSGWLRVRAAPDADEGPGA